MVVVRLLMAASSRAGQHQSHSLERERLREGLRGEGGRGRTWRMPESERSPRSLTWTRSESESLTRSSGSETVVGAVSMACG